MKSRFTTAIATLGVATMVAASGSSIAAASTGGHSDTTAAHSSHSAKKASPVDSPAAELRVGLTALLQEHVYLAGIATGTALAGGDLAPPAATLDANSVRLSEAIGSVYGKAAGETFLALWRKHIGFFVDYAMASAKGDDAAKEVARTGLDGYRQDFGAFISSANPNLSKKAVADALIPHIQTLFAAIDAQAAKDPAQFDKLAEAASHMPDTAEVLAAGIAKQFPKKFGK